MTIVKEERCLTCGHNRVTRARSLPKAEMPALFALERLTQHTRDEWAHIDQLGTSAGGDFAKLRYWGLIEKKPHKVGKKKSSGFWRITETGKLFIEGRAKVRARADIVETECVGWRGKWCSIREVVEGAGFDYQELMRPEPDQE